MSVLAVCSAYRYGVELAYALLTICFFGQNVKQSGREPVFLLADMADPDYTLRQESFGLSLQGTEYAVATVQIIKTLTFDGR